MPEGSGSEFKNSDLPDPVENGPDPQPRTEISDYKVHMKNLPRSAIPATGAAVAESPLHPKATRLPRMLKIRTNLNAYSSNSRLIGKLFLLKNVQSGSRQIWNQNWPQFGSVIWFPDFRARIEVKISRLILMKLKIL